MLQQAMECLFVLRKPLYVLSSDPHLETLAHLSSLALAIKEINIPVVFVTSSRYREGILRKLLTDSRTQVITVSKLSSTCVTSASHLSHVLILDAYSRTPARRHCELLSKLMRSTRSTVVSCCLQPEPALFKLITACPKFHLSGAKSCEEMMATLCSEVSLFHYTGFIRMPATFVSVPPQSRLHQKNPSTKTAEQVVPTFHKYSDSVDRLYSVLPTIITEVKEGKKLALVSGVPAAFLPFLATEVRLKYDYNEVMCDMKQVMMVKSARAASRGSLILLTFSQTLRRLKDIEALGYECVLLDVPINTKTWIHLNFGSSAAGCALKVVMNNTLTEQYTMQRINRQLAKKMRFWQGVSSTQVRHRVLRRQLRMPVVFKPEVVQAIRFFILLRCLFVKHRDLAHAACRSPPAFHSLFYQLDVLQRFTHSSLLYERRLCKIACIMTTSVAAEPLLMRWVQNRPAYLHPSIYADVLGSIPPDDIQQCIASFLTEAPLDAMDMITTRYGRFLLDGRDTCAFLAVVKTLPPYLQDQIICAYPHAQLFAEKHLASQ
uniref:Uncharacterized protein n=1 Tax=viral metagenome TaxID=1070528 RepID=A0A6C0C2C4_9ZZZZ